MLSERKAEVTAGTRYRRRPPRDHPRRWYSHVVGGAKTAVSAAAATSTQSSCAAVALPCMSPRSAVARWLVGLTSATALGHDGMLPGSTKTLLMKVSGKRITNPMLITALG